MNKLTEIRKTKKERNNDN